MDSDLRNKIQIFYFFSRLNLDELSDIELAGLYSKNKNNFDIFELLLKNNNTSNEILNKMLHQIVQYTSITSSFNAVKLLIDYGADINSIDSTGNTALILACETLYKFSNIEIINFLIERGANVNIKNSLGRTALTKLIVSSYKYSDLECIYKIIIKSNQINYKDNFGMTPLMMCFICDYNSPIRYHIIKFLLDNKADVYIKNKFNKNILDIVKDKIRTSYEKQKEENSDVLSLIFNYKNIKDDNYCECDIYFIYNYF